MTRRVCLSDIWRSDDRLWVKNELTRQQCFGQPIPRVLYHEVRDDAAYGFPFSEQLGVWARESSRVATIEYSGAK